MRPTDADLAPSTDAADGASLPLSFAQQRMWILHHYAPDVPLYNSPIAFRIRGPLSAPVLERALRLLAERHEGMRTTFPSVDGMPEVEISEEVSFHLPVEELQELPAATREEAALERATAEARRVFDMARGPLWRALLLRLAPEEHLFVLTMHHIITDGWSMGLLCQELSRTYEALWSGHEPVLPELPIQYADFAAWQREWLSGDVLASQLAYWKERLAGIPPVIDLPTDRPRPAKNSYRAARYPLLLPASLTKPLEALSAKVGVTPFMTLLSAFGALLGRYTRGNDIVVGMPIANRNRAEIERLVGFFVNTLVLRINLEGRPSFLELLQRVRQVTLGAYDHQDLPFEKLVEELSPERNQSHSPIFQVLFDFATTDLSLSLPGMETTRLRLDEGASSFDVSVSLEKRGDSYGGHLTYNVELFDEATLARMAGHFARLLGAAVEQPERSVAELPLLAEDEERQLLVDWNATAAEAPRERGIHELFEARATLHPERVALIHQDGSLTYGELNQRANQLAHHLRARGVGPETRVLLCMERRGEAVLGMLGILKAGGAYVPVEPSFPKQRLAHVLESSRAPMILTLERHLAALPAHGAEVLCLDSGWEALAHESRENPAPVGPPELLAYVIFTSGSTGQPKGVAIAHAQLLNYVRSITERLDLAGCESFALVSTLAADLGHTVLFPSLCSGGTLHVLTQDLATDPDGLSDYFRRNPMDCLKIVPSHLAVLLTGSTPEGVLPRKRLILGGEASSQALIDRVRALAPGCEVFNHYGPTETTVGVLSGRVEEPAPTTVPLGRPLSNTHLYVVDSSLRPVPVGVPGELLVGGAGLARGYLERPELTAERFIPDPFSRQPGARLYRTGDLTRYLPDGRIEYLGRIDQQVKIRGFRIELGEVELALRQHPAVREAAVVAWEGGPDGKQLVAYVAGEAGQLSAPELRAFMREHLPDYMVPSSFVVLESLPLTANGKLDRRALPAPTPSAGPSRGFIPPRDRIELQLCGIWEELLKVRPIGVRDDFFELGGTSLIAVRLMHRIRQTFGRSLPISALFTSKSVEELALLLRQETHVEEWTPLVPIQPRGKRPPFYCVHPLGGSVLGFSALARRLGPEQPFFGLEHVRPGRPTNRVEAMATEYLAAIRKHQPKGPYLLGGKSVGGLVAIEMARMLQAEGERVELLALLGTAVPKDHLGIETSNWQEGLYPTKEDALIGRMLHQFGSQYPELHELARLNREQKLHQGLSIAKQHGALPADFGETQLEHMFWAWYAEAEAFAVYHSRFYDGHLTHFVPACDAGTPLMDWSSLCRSWEVHVVAGEHETLDEEPHVEVLAKALGTCLERVNGSSS